MSGDGDDVEVFWNSLKEGWTKLEAARESRVKTAQNAAAKEAVEFLRGLAARTKEDGRYGEINVGQWTANELGTTLEIVFMKGHQRVSDRWVLTDDFVLTAFGKTYDLQKPEGDQLKPDVQRKVREHFGPPVR